MTRRLPIVPGVGAPDLLDLADAEGWTVLAVLEAGDNSPFQVVWTTGAGTGTVTYVDDATIDVDYFTVDGPSPGVEETLRRRGLIFTAVEVADLVDACTTPHELLAATCYAGVAAGRHATPDLLRVLERGLADPHAEVRRVAVLASAYAGWPELLPSLAHIEQSDPDREARDLAARVGQLLQKEAGP